ncbi:MAG: hypothetical protein JO297_20530, partial [Nitrososphaeraceae archaeon]|nr:hypothetical protein [Nitrososphaeraceae archaeon]
MKTRTTDQTIKSILNSAINGVTKTNMMYNAFISFDQLNEFICLLVEKGLIEYMEGTGLYRTTEKGIGFLEQEDSAQTMRFNKVLVIGLGQLGLPVAKYVMEKGFDTYGYDISSIAMERAEKTAGIKLANDFSDFDVYILCVSTHKP